MIATVDEEWALKGAAAKPVHLLLRSPAQLAEDPALLIALAKTRRQTLDDRPYCIVPDIFLAAGHRVASFDLANHGDNRDEHGDGLAGMAAAMSAGVDVLEQVRTLAREVVEIAVRRGLVRPGNIFASGTSRGGNAALHAMAAEPRIAAAAVFAPVTRWSALSEFAHLADSPIACASDTTSLIDKLIGRDVFLSIGMNDQRVKTIHCLDLHARLQLANPIGQTCLHVDPTEGHRVSDAAHGCGAAFLLNRAARGAG